MNIVFSPQAWEDYLYRQETSPARVMRINELLKDIARHPYTGIGKPEPLRFDLRGLWSRRITQEHRLVYRVVEDGVFIVQAKLHYRK